MIFRLFGRPFGNSKFWRFGDCFVDVYASVTKDVLLTRECVHVCVLRSPTAAEVRSRREILAKAAAERAAAEVEAMVESEVETVRQIYRRTSAIAYAPPTSKTKHARTYLFV
jgi:hypothetical protein